MSKPNIETLQAQQSPGCFGSPSCFASDSDFCKACVGYDDCGEESFKTLNRIKDVINVEDLFRKHTIAMAKAKEDRLNAEKALRPSKTPRKTPTKIERKTKVEKVELVLDEKTAELIDALPVKLKPYAINLHKNGLIDRIKKDLVRNVNPLALSKSSPAFLSLAIDALIKGGFTKAELKSIYMQERGWTESTAGSHVSLVVSLFVAFDIAVERNQKFTASPTLLCDNEQNS
jgi:hypothetical protein